MAAKIEWEEVAVTAGTYVKFSDPGDGITGRVVEYSPDSGATTFDGDDCGYITIQDDDGEFWTVTLDKPQLQRVVAAAEPVKGMLLDVRFHEWRKSEKSGREYKVFKVRRSLAGIDSFRAKQQAAAMAKKPSKVVDLGPDEAPF